MIAAAKAPSAWPQLRQELSLHTGPTGDDGAPTWTLHDPARNRYFSLDWQAFAVVSRLHLGSMAAVLESLHRETPLQLRAADVEGVLNFLNEAELVQRTDEASAQWLTQRRHASRHSLLATLVHGYLFFRVPLVDPDAWLGRWAPRLAALYTRAFAWLTLWALGLGLWGAWRQWDVFTATLVDTFSWSGLVAYAGALVAVKLVHELGHAVTAKRQGCRVPAMGVAFLVMWPMAYTDVTESWKLPSHAARLKIAVAGIATELAVAAWALLAWTLLPDGALRSTVFFLATTSIVATLAINASPFMRFDGYFVLSDLLGLPNLHARSFALARWWLRERLFALGEPAPEAFAPGLRRALILFALATWAYRLVVFLGIALMVYHLFFKAVGLLLFAVEIWYFILRPIVAEAREWQRRRERIASNPSSRRLGRLGLVAAAVLLLPWDLSISTQGLLRPAQHLKVIAPVAARIDASTWRVGDRVLPGQPLVTLSAPDLDDKIARHAQRLATLEAQTGLVGFDATARARQSLLQQEATAEREILSGLQQEKARLSPQASFEATVVDVTPDLHPGETVPRGTPLLTVAALQDWWIDAYVLESDLQRLSVGAWARFVPEGSGRASLSARVTEIFPEAATTIEETVLATSAGGEVLTRHQDNRLIPERAVYRIRLRVLDPAPPGFATQLRGRLTIVGWPRSIAGEALRHAAAVVVREAGF